MKELYYYLVLYQIEKKHMILFNTILMALIQLMECQYTQYTIHGRNSLKNSIHSHPILSRSACNY